MDLPDKSIALFLELERIRDRITAIESDRDSGVDYYQEYASLLILLKEKEAHLLTIFPAGQLERCRIIREALRSARSNLAELRHLYKRKVRPIRPRGLVYQELISEIESQMARAGFANNWGRIGATKIEIELFKEALRQEAGIPLGEGIVCAVCSDPIVRNANSSSGDNSYCSKPECLRVMKEAERMRRWLCSAESMAKGLCIFGFGGCDRRAGPSGFCTKHEGKRCYRCGQQAMVETGSQVNAAWEPRFACEDHISYI